MKRLLFILVFLYFSALGNQAADGLAHNSFSEGGALQPVSKKYLIITLNDALETALQHNPKLNLTRAKLAIYDADITISKARYNPSLVSDSGIAEKTYRLGIEKIFELGNKRGKRIEVAKANKEVNLAELEVQTLDLKAETRQAYTQLYILQEKNKSYEEISSAAEAFHKIAIKREEGGEIANLEVLEIELSLLNTRNELEDIKAQLVEAQLKFNSLLNYPLDTKLELLNPAQVLDTSASDSKYLQAQINENLANLQELTSSALLNRPELKQNFHSKISSQKELELAKASRIPNLALTVGPDLVLNDSGNDIGVFIMSNLQLPILNRQQGQIQSALAKQSIFDKEYLALENQIKYEVHSAFNTFSYNKERIKRYEEELLPKAQTINDKSKRCFEEGKCSALIPIAAQRSLINTKLGYLESLMAYQNSISNLERSTGTEL